MFRKLEVVLNDCDVEKAKICFKADLKLVEKILSLKEKEKVFFERTGIYSAIVSFDDMEVIFEINPYKENPTAFCIKPVVIKINNVHILHFSLENNAQYTELISMLKNAFQTSVEYKKQLKLFSQKNLYNCNSFITI